MLFILRSLSFIHNSSASLLPPSVLRFTRHIYQQWRQSHGLRRETFFSSAHFSTKRFGPFPRVLCESLALVCALPRTMSFFHFSPIPSFTTPTGPYSVGTHEVEIPASELSSPAPGPSISTVSYRIFYPCSPATKGKVKYAYWLPDPQHEYFTAYARFLRASSWLASLLRYICHASLFPSIRAVKTTSTEPTQLLPSLPAHLPYHHPRGSFYSSAPLLPPLARRHLLPRPGRL